MVPEIIAILSALLILVLSVILIGIARSVLKELQTESFADARTSSILSRFWSWLNKAQPMLDYRRDKRGRFRKIRRW